jgi:CO/xanthine dehydrogenase FAD-binding subunit
MAIDSTAFSPSTLAEAYGFLNEHGRKAKIIAGGTDLMVLMNSHMLDAREFIDIWRLDELRGITDEGDTLRIGALTTFTQIIASPLIQLSLPALVDAARTIGAIQIQNRGTIGGNMVNASPAGDSLPVLAAYEAEVEVGSGRGVRTIAFSQFYTGYRKTVLEPDEIVLGVRMRKLRPNERSFFSKVGARRAQAISKIVMAVKVALRAGGIDSITIGLGSVAPTVIRAVQTESSLTGMALDPTAIEHARSAISQEIAPITDVRSTERYRRAVTGNVLAKILYQLV